MKFYLEDAQTVLKHFQCDETGLSESEAAERLAENGRNKLIEPPKTTLLRRFINQLVNPMIIVLLAAAVASAVTAVYAHESFADVFIILFVVVLNSVLGVIQENKAEKAIEALKEMTAATSRVWRDGQVLIIKSEDLVTGDIILLEAGDAVPADARLIESASLKAEEAPLTGESVSVDKEVVALDLQGGKDISLGDRSNMVYMGSIIVYGRGRAVVTATGMDTEMGKIATSIAQAKESQTPLQIKLDQLGKILTILVLSICAVIFVVSLVRANGVNSSVILNTFMLAVSLAVAAIPEGLAAVVTIVLSIGVTKMSKNNAVIRRLTAVETLGCTQVICSDKTGTLTQNKMTVVDHYGDDAELLATAFALCSDAELGSDGNAIGEPTEAALVNYAAKLGYNKNTLKEVAPRIGEAPFDSSRKMMSTVHDQEDKIIQYTKGAPDELLKCCKYVQKGSQIVSLDDQLRHEILGANRDFAAQALRVLGAAYRVWPEVPEDYSPAILENELIFIGLAGMIDPVRPEVLAAIEHCKSAGIRAVMITGDHRETAAAIASELGIISDRSEAITGMELDEISDEELVRTIGNYSVFARVQPEHKVRIVNAWRANNYITAMTGDGVNDAPAIKSADIGVGMGITGTDVTKNVADMVLADDNFATIVAAVKEGRRIYDNIRKTIQFLLASNLSEVIAIFAATIMGFTILHPVHILWINLITDSLPALALGMEKGEQDLMQRAPRDAKEGVFANGVGTGVVYQGFAVAALTLMAYFIGHYVEAGVWEITNSEDGITMAFLTLSMAEIFHSFNLRSLRGSIFFMQHHNRYLYGSMILSMILTAGVIYIPALATLFGFEHISLLEYLIAMSLAISIIPIVEIVKLCQRTYMRSKSKCI
jgi:P-type Ca2+ transporter type 2C